MNPPIAAASRLSPRREAGLTRWARGALARAALPLARARRRALARENALDSQRSALARLLRAGAGTAFARDHELDARPESLAALPVQTYESLLPYVERCLRGEAGVLLRGFIDSFAVSSGTTAATTKYLPVNGAMLRNFRRGGLDALALHVARAGRADVFGGRQLFLGGSTALEPVRSDPRVLTGDLSGIMARQLPWWVDRFLYSPGADVALLGDWPRKVRAIAERSFDQDVRLVAGIPSWLLVLFEQVREVGARRGLRVETLHDVWPRLEVVVHGGVQWGPYRALFDRWFGRPVSFQEVYPASEGFIATQDLGSGEGLRLLTDAGLYFEFLSVAKLQNGAPMPGARPLALAEVECGRDYALLLTTPGGLRRYLIGDVVRFVSLQPPRIQFIGRTRLELSAFGEHVIEHEVVAAVEAAARRFQLLVRDFTVAPWFPPGGVPGARGRHQWFFELVGPAVPPAVLSDLLDRELRLRNDDYRAKRDGGGLLAPAVELLPPGSFDRAMARRGKLGGQHKVPRLRSDRDFADLLAASVPRRDEADLLAVTGL